MKTWFISIVLIVFFGVTGSGLISQPAPADARPAPALPSQAIVQIIHTRERRTGNSIEIVQGTSLGTIIGPRLILTHNHFSGGLGTLPNETVTIIDSTGRSFPMRTTDVKQVAFDTGTLFLQLPADISLPAASLADQALAKQLTPDDWVTVNYWDETTNQLAAKAFKFIQMKNGVVMLADPEHVINPGDSGGGVYFNGQLIGNTRSYNADANDNPLGTFNVALVPPQVATVQRMLD
jgi:hypothetical protein